MLMAVFSMFPIFVMLDCRMKVLGGRVGGVGVFCICGSGGSITGLCRPQRPIVWVGVVIDTDMDADGLGLDDLQAN